MNFTKSFLLIVSISYFLLSTNAVPTTRSVIPSFNAQTPAGSRAGSLIGISTIFKDSAKTTQQIIRVSPRVILFCKDTENPALCVETIAPYLQGEFNPILALETEIKATLNQSLKISNIIAQSLSHPSNEAKAALRICKSQYRNIVDTIREASELLNQQNVVDAYYKFSSVMADRSSCEDAIAECQGVENPFSEDSQIIYQLGGNCLAILDGIINSSIHF
ncbi:putative pectinesterase inhibitor domain-containing protein [Lupinus albus]|uniref:Putative pectinesterase inhibitor domain-containing protein n=1 Tax=Lupinus albus TaxID=3870 RepID=A0A6A4NSR6_LUPAL|nr:putative pectinesterase inhibitor domain-containing protein [Lupinus albus]